MSTDLFSKQATIYLEYRPQYPTELYHFILEHVEGNQLAWDCATGNGQAARDLSKYFSQVIASDISENQIKNAIPAENITYKVLKAEQPLDPRDHSVNLVTVAQALHWFDLDKFYPEVKRLLKPRGIFATWAYSFHSPIQDEIDFILNRFYFETLGPYWKPNNKLIWNRYKDLVFPFTEIASPAFTLEVDWSLNELMGYFRTWSATQLFKDQNHLDPTEPLLSEISEFWGNPDAKKRLQWDLVTKIGRP